MSSIMNDWSDYAYEGVRRVCYGDERATFIPVCNICHRFVKADKTININEISISPGPNATCAKHGRVEMLFEGFV